MRAGEEVLEEETKSHGSRSGCISSSLYDVGGMLAATPHSRKAIAALPPQVRYFNERRVGLSSLSKQRQHRWCVRLGNLLEVFHERVD